MKSAQNVPIDHMSKSQILNQTQTLNALRQGDLVAIPTETVYGLAADAGNQDAVARIFATKGRPQHNPLIVHVSNLEHAQKLGIFNRLAHQLANHFWPGPLTLVVPLRDTYALAKSVTAGLGTIGLRVPAHEGTRALLAHMEFGLAAPSANPSGRLSSSRAEHIFEAFDHQIPVMEGPAPTVGLESSIVKVTDDEVILLREGAITRQAVEQILGRTIHNRAHSTDKSSDKPQAPGMLLVHYAPSVPLFKNASDWQSEDALLGFGPMPPSPPEHYLNLSEKADLQEAARNLYAMLHALDARRPPRILVQPIPERGIGIAINDRLTRASAAKPTS